MNVIRSIGAVGVGSVVALPASAFGQSAPAAVPIVGSPAAQRPSQPSAPSSQPTLPPSSTSAPSTPSSTMPGPLLTGVRMLKLSLQNGTVALNAQNVTLREIFAEWQRQTGCQFVNAEKLPATPVALQFPARHGGAGRARLDHARPRQLDHRLRLHRGAWSWSSGPVGDRLELRRCVHPAVEPARGDGRLRPAAGDPHRRARIVPRRDPAGRPGGRAGARTVRTQPAVAGTAAAVSTDPCSGRCRRRTSRSPPAARPRRRRVRDSDRSRQPRRAPAASTRCRPSNNRSSRRRTTDDDGDVTSQKPEASSQRPAHPWRPPHVHDRRDLEFAALPRGAARTAARQRPRNLPHLRPAEEGLAALGHAARVSSFEFPDPDLNKRRSNRSARRLAADQTGAGS